MWGRRGACGAHYLPPAAGWTVKPELPRCSSCSWRCPCPCGGTPSGSCSSWKDPGRWKTGRVREGSQKPPPRITNTQTEPTSTQAGVQSMQGGTGDGVYIFSSLDQSHTTTAPALQLVFGQEIRQWSFQHLQLLYLIQSDNRCSDCKMCVCVRQWTSYRAVTRLSCVGEGHRTPMFECNWTSAADGFSLPCNLAIRYVKVHTCVVFFGRVHWQVCRTKQSKSDCSPVTTANINTHQTHFPIFWIHLLQAATIRVVFTLLMFGSFITNWCNLLLPCRSRCVCVSLLAQVWTLVVWLMCHRMKPNCI